MITTLALLIGAVTAVGALCLIAGLRRPLPHLAATLERLDDRYRLAAVEEPLAKPVATGDQLERAGIWAMRRLRLAPSPRTLATLRLRGVSPARLYGEQVVMATVLPFVVLIVVSMATLVVHLPLSVPVGLVGFTAIAGWFTPRLLLNAAAASTNTDANEAILVYYDLVVLERNADRSMREALANASKVSDIPLFLQIRHALERADLAREPSWIELDRLGKQLNLTALSDLADISRLDGNALADALRARVAELRNAHVNAAQTDADRVTARMVIWQTLPVLMVSGLFVLPPLMILVQG